jgi:hypothetical protein
MFPVKYERYPSSVFKIKDRTMDSVQSCDGYINIPSSQTHRYFIYSLYVFYMSRYEGASCIDVDNVLPRFLHFLRFRLASVS